VERGGFQVVLTVQDTTGYEQTRKTFTHPQGHGANKINNKLARKQRKVKQLNDMLALMKNEQEELNETVDKRIRAGLEKRDPSGKWPAGKSRVPYRLL
jgi:hypothetical protein